MNIESIELVNVFFYSCTETFLYSDQDRDLVVLFHSMIQHELRFFFWILVFCSCNHCAHRAKILHREEPVDRYKPSGTISFTCSTHERQTTASWLLVFFCSFAMDGYYDYFEPADWAHSEIQNTKPYLYGSPCYTVRLPYFLLTYATYMCGKFCFSKSKLIHVAGYTIYFCIISKTDFHCLLLFVCFILFFFSLGGFNDLSMVRMDLFSISNSIWSDYSLNLDSVEWCNAIFRFAYFYFWNHLWFSRISDLVMHSHRDLIEWPKFWPRTIHGLNLSWF